jgi:hypothetical protein
MDQVPIRRALTEDNLMAWLNIYIVAKIANVQLSNKKDVFNWDLRNHGQFFVRSICTYLINQIPFSLINSFGN